MSQHDREDCFGSLWEERAPECCGGRELTTGRTFPRCHVYEQCGRVSRMNQAGRHLQAPQQSQPYSPVPVHAQQVPLTVPQPPRPLYNQPVPQARQVYTPQTMQTQNQYPAVYHPTLSLQYNEAAPFLTVLEPQDVGMGRFWSVLAEAGRAGVKGVLMQSTYMVDHIPFRQKG